MGATTTNSFQVTRSRFSTPTPAHDQTLATHQCKGGQPLTYLTMHPFFAGNSTRPSHPALSKTIVRLSIHYDNTARTEDLYKQRTDHTKLTGYKWDHDGDHIVPSDRIHVASHHRSKLINSPVPGSLLRVFLMFFFVGLKRPSTSSH